MQRVVKDMAEKIGIGDTIEIVRRWGGRQLAVPVKVGIADPLALVLGLETARCLVEHFGGQRLQLPAERNALLDLRNEAIARDVAAGESQEVVALRYGLTRQGVKKVLWMMKGRREVAEKFGATSTSYLQQLTEGDACAA
jgi:hypothetical protein